MLRALLTPLSFDISNLAQEARAGTPVHEFTEVQISVEETGMASPPTAQAGMDDGGAGLLLLAALAGGAAAVRLGQRQFVNRLSAAATSSDPTQNRYLSDLSLFLAGSAWFQYDRAASQKLIDFSMQAIVGESSASTLIELQYRTQCALDLLGVLSGRKKQDDGNLLGTPSRHSGSLFTKLIQRPARFFSQFTAENVSRLIAGARSNNGEIDIECLQILHDLALARPDLAPLIINGLADTHDPLKLSLKALLDIAVDSRLPDISRLASRAAIRQQKAHH